MTTSSYRPSEQEEKFERYHDHLRKELNNANHHFTIWKYLQDIRNDYRRELNQAPGFFRLTMNAHLLSAIMRLIRFFDKDRKKRALSIYEFLDFVQQNLALFSNQAFEDRMRQIGRWDKIDKTGHTAITDQIVEQHRQELTHLPLDNLGIWRNKELAHIEKEFVLQRINVFKKYAVEKQEIDNIIDTLDNVLNEYRSAYDFSIWDKDLGVETGIQAVVDAIRFKIQEQRKRRRL